MRVLFERGFAAIQARLGRQSRLGRALTHLTAGHAFGLLLGAALTLILITAAGPAAPAAPTPQGQWGSGWDGLAVGTPVIVGAVARPECPAGKNPDCLGVFDPSPVVTPPADFALNVPILEYHRIKPFEDETGVARGLITPPEIFEAQISALRANGWRAITMAQLSDYLRRGVQAPRKAIVITFDDGYRDGYFNAMPILTAHRFVGTFFVVADRIGHPTFLTAKQLQVMIARGMEIGNHTLDHRQLTKLSQSELIEETLGASQLISMATGVWPKSFAYPAGLASDDAIAAVEACPGMQTAVVETATKPQTWANRWELSRIRVGSGMTPQELLDKLERYL